MDVQTLAPIALIALPIALCIVIVIRLVHASLYVRAHNQEQRRRAQQEQQDCCMQERLRQALVQQEVELRLLHLLAELHRLRQVMGSSEDSQWYLPECLMPLEERRLALEHCTHLLYSMALDRRVTQQEVANLESEIQHLWSRYYVEQ